MTDPLTENFNKLYDDRIQWIGAGICAVFCVVTLFTCLGFVGIAAGFGVVIYGVIQSDRRMKQYSRSLQ